MNLTVRTRSNIFKITDASSIRTDQLGNVMISDVVENQNGKDESRLVAMISPQDFLSLTIDEAVEVESGEQPAAEPNS